MRHAASPYNIIQEACNAAGGAHLLLRTVDQTALRSGGRIRLACAAVGGIRSSLLRQRRDAALLEDAPLEWTEALVIITAL
jgi:hypothetical protein